MVLQKVPRNPAMEAVDLFRRVDTGHSDMLLTDPSRADAVMARITESLKESLAQPTTTRGWHAQSMFASIVASLDACDLMTSIDMGDIYYDGGEVKAPDLFLHLRDGRRLLVDVKSHNVDPGNFDAPVKFSRSEIARLTRYADLLGGELHLAIYLAGMPYWTLIPIDELESGPGGGYRITPTQAIVRNRMATLGDVVLGTVFPLAVSLTPDPSVPHPVDDGGLVDVVDGAMTYSAGGKEITVIAEQRLVAFMTYFGSWPVQERPRLAGGNLVEMRWQADPVEDTGQGFEIVGSLSTLYARMYESGTTSAAGVTALDPFIRPGTLATLLPHDYVPVELPLWRLHQSQENFATA